jgi:hypothetical protein
MTPFDKLVRAVEAANSPFDLGDDFPMLKSGLADLSKWRASVESRLKALETPEEKS